MKRSFGDLGQPHEVKFGRVAANSRGISRVVSYAWILPLVSRFKLKNRMKMKIKFPLRLVVAEESKSKAYPTDVKKFLYGLYATLHLSESSEDVEKIIYYAFRNGYVIGASSQGADDQEIQDRLPDFGLDDKGSDAKR